MYPYFRPRVDRSQFRFPPLGVLYVAAAVRAAGHEVRVLDCTFLRREEAARLALAARADVVGISCLSTLEDDCFGWRGCCAGAAGCSWPAALCRRATPGAFSEHFDVVVRGEGERTMVDLLAALEDGGDPAGVPGVVTRGCQDGRTAPPRPFEADLDALPFPARDLLPNGAYLADGRRR